MLRPLFNILYTQGAKLNDQLIIYMFKTTITYVNEQNGCLAGNNKHTP